MIYYIIVQHLLCKSEHSQMPYVWDDDVAPALKAVAVQSSNTIRVVPCDDKDESVLMKVTINSIHGIVYVNKCESLSTILFLYNGKGYKCTKDMDGYSVVIDEFTYYLENNVAYLVSEDPPYLFYENVRHIIDIPTDTHYYLYKCN